MSKRRQQKGKHKKRKRSWHRGKSEHYRWERAVKKWPKEDKDGV